jgi:hypothetical protein
MLPLLIDAIFTAAYAVSASERCLLPPRWLTPPAAAAERFSYAMMLTPAFRFRADIRAADIHAIPAFVSRHAAAAAMAAAIC